MTDPPCISYSIEDLPNGKVRLWCSLKDINAARGTPPIAYHFIGTEEESHRIKDADFEDNFIPYKPKPHIAHLYRAETDPREQARVDEIIDAYDKHKAECDALSRALGRDRVEKESDAAADALYDLYHEAAAIHTTTLIGLQAKAEDSLDVRMAKRRRPRR